MPIVLNGTTGINTPLIEGAALASQAEALAGTDNTKLMTPLRVSQVITAQQRTFSTMQLFTTSGTFNTPAGVTTALVIVIGGGGGGASWSSSAGGNGGLGGLSAGIISVSGAMSVTVGAGGLGNAAGNGAAGTSSSFSTLSATGGAAGAINGANGANGTGSGGVAGIGIPEYAYVMATPVCLDQLPAINAGTGNPTNSTAAVPYPGVTSAVRAGSQGPGASSQFSPNNIGRGGYGGAVFIFY